MFSKAEAQVAKAHLACLLKLLELDGTPETIKDHLEVYVHSQRLTSIKRFANIDEAVMKEKAQKVGALLRQRD